MNKNFTPKQVNYKEKEDQLEPSSVTLDFLKKFARSFCVDKSLPKLLNQFHLN